MTLPLRPPSGINFDKPVIATLFGETFGGKPLLNVNGEQACAGVAILRMFQSGGCEAEWIEAYNDDVRTGPQPFCKASNLW